MADIVRVINDGLKPLRVVFDSRATIIPPGGEGIVEREAAVIHFGDWTATGAKRAAEVRRLRGLAGSNEDGKSALEHDAVWNERKPQVTLIDGDGSPIIGVLDDPEGTSMVPAMAPDPARQISLLQEQLDRLQAQMAESHQPQPGRSDATEDRPDLAVRKRGRQVTVQGAEELLRAEEG